MSDNVHFLTNRISVEVFNSSRVIIDLWLNAFDTVTIHATTSTANKIIRALIEQDERRQKRKCA